MVEIIGFPSNNKASVAVEAEIKLGGHQASAADIIKRGQAVLDRLESNLTWEVEWRDLILALGSGRDLALRAAETDKPCGPKYRKAIGAWLRCYGFDRIDEGDRSRLIFCFDNLVAINAWRAKLPVEKQKAFNHPQTVLMHWKRSLRPAQSNEQGKKPIRPPVPPITIDMVLAWAATANQEDKRRVATMLDIDIVTQERRSAEAQQKRVVQFVKKVLSATMTNETPARQVENVKAAIKAYAKPCTSDWADRMDPELSRFTHATPAALAHPPTKH
jgi:hypothetical protein